MEKRRRKAQLTMFFIIALLVVMIILGGYLVFYKYQKSKIKSEQEISNIISFMDICYENSLRVLIFLVSFGGYYETPKYSTEDGIPYYFIGEKNLTPSLDQLEKELEKGLKNEFLFCLNNFSAFAKSPFNIVPEELNTSASIEKESVNLRINYELKVVWQDNRVNVINYSKQNMIEVKFMDIYDLATKIANEYTKAKGYMFLTKSLELPKAEGLDVSYANFGEDIIFRITDLNSSLFGKRFIFLFAGKV